MMMTENDRLSNQVRQLSEESENWKLRYVNMENLIASIPKLEADNTDLTEEVRRLNEQIE